MFGFNKDIRIVPIHMDMGILRWASHAAERGREGGGRGRGRGRGMGRGRDLVMICTALPSNRRKGYRTQRVSRTILTLPNCNSPINTQLQIPTARIPRNQRMDCRTILTLPQLPNNHPVAVGHLVGYLQHF